MTEKLSGPHLGEYEKGKQVGEASAAEGRTLHDAAEQARLAAEADAKHKAVADYSERHNGRVA